MDRLLNSIKGHSGAQDAMTAQPRFGRVTSVDPSQMSVRVQLQPEGVLTGWLPVLSAWVGDGWGLVSPPAPGDQVLVLPQEGDAENGIVVGRSWSASSPPPVAPIGELWLCHRSGSFVKLSNDGTIRINGDLHVTGEVYDRFGRLSGLRDTYNRHVHQDSRGGTTGRPVPQDTEEGA